MGLRFRILCLVCLSAGFPITPVSTMLAAGFQDDDSAASTAKTQCTAAELGPPKLAENNSGNHEKTGTEGFRDSSDPTPPATPGENFFDKWFSMVAKTQAEQPHWITPVVTVTPRLEQEFRYDISRQTQPNLTTLDNYGGGKGLEIIPAERVEIIISPPPFISRSKNGVPDGYGDMSFLLKYRLLAGNEEGGNYILTAFLGGSLPTDSYTNGARNATITPTIAAGKGWGMFDATSTLGVNLPVEETDKIGRQVVWSTAFQYRVYRKIWPELEVNSTFFCGGPNDGKKQTFLTPGFVLGKFPIWHRLSLTIGAGVQIAATQFHQYNHKYILTVRFPF